MRRSCRDLSHQDHFVWENNSSLLFLQYASPDFQDASNVVELHRRAEYSVLEGINNDEILQNKQSRSPQVEKSKYGKLSCTQMCHSFIKKPKPRFSWRKLHIMLRYICPAPQKKPIILSQQRECISLLDIFHWYFATFLSHQSCTIGAHSYNIVNWSLLRLNFGVPSGYGNYGNAYAR